MKHVAILRKQPFYKIISGKKVIETRWSMNKIVPFNALKENDVIYLKETGKDVSARAEVEKVEYYLLNDSVIKQIIKKYHKEICICDKEKFYFKVKDKKYCSLIWLKNIEKIEPIKVKKSNGAGWLIIE